MDILARYSFFFLFFFLFFIYLFFNFCYRCFMLLVTNLTESPLAPIQEYMYVINHNIYNFILQCVRMNDNCDSEISI